MVFAFFHGLSFQVVKIKEQYFIVVFERPTLISAASNRKVVMDATKEEPVDYNAFGKEYLYLILKFISFAWIFCLISSLQVLLSH